MPPKSATNTSPALVWKMEMWLNTPSVRQVAGWMIDERTGGGHQFKEHNRFPPMRQIVLFSEPFTVPGG